MKRILAAILALAVILTLSASALAELNIDFSGYSDDELLELQTLLNNELEERNIVTTKLHKLYYGRYYVGTDIPEGNFLFHLASGVPYGVVMVYDETGEVFNSDFISELGTKFSLKEGQYFDVGAECVEVEKLEQIAW